MCIRDREKLVATIRSREISACLVLQAQSQLKAIYKDNADTIIGNMDTSIFLGGKEPTTLKELAAVLGKETIDTYNTGELSLIHIFELAVKGMLPKGPLGRSMLTKLHVYAGPEHEQAAQKPEVLEIKF